VISTEPDRPENAAALGKWKQDRPSLFRMLLDRADDSIEIIDPATGRFLDCTEQSYSALGYTRAEFLSLSVPDIDPLVTPPIFAQNVTRIREHGTATFESLHRRKDGSTFPVEVSARLLQLDREYLLAIVRDITARKQSEEALRLAKFSMDRTADAVYWIDPQANILDVNEAACLMLGYSKDELCAMTVHDLNPDFQRDMWPRFWADAQRRGTMMIETSHRTKDGRLIPIEVSVNYLAYEGKEYHCAFVRDITARKRTEEALRRSEAFFTSMVENLPNMVFVKDATDLKFVRFNKAGEDLLGHPREALIGKNDYDFFSKEEADFFTENDRQVLQSGRLMDIPEESIQTRNKGARTLHTKKVPIFDTDGAPQFLMGISEDITERKQLEAQFQQSKKMEAVGRLAGGVAHDFNNLLTVINGYSEILLNQLPPGDPLSAMAKETLQAGERARSLTGQLLAFSRRQILRPQPLDLNDPIRSISSMLERLLGETIVLAIDLEPNLWTIHSDKGHIDQVLMNLAVNARDAMPNGGDLTIATRNVVVTRTQPTGPGMVPPGEYVQVSMGDNGQGMSQDTLAHLFEPFFTTKPEGTGTGLGLATVHGIVTQSRGTIVVDSALGQGTTFHLYFPRFVAPLAPPQASSQGHRTIGSETVLVVEDQDSVRNVIIHGLKHQGYQVTAAAGGEEALRLAGSLPEPIQVLVTDVIMPHMTGPVLAQRLRQIWPGLLVLFMSGYTDQADPAFLDEPGTAFIQKPFVPSTLAKSLRELLDRPI